MYSPRQKRVFVQSEHDLRTNRRDRHAIRQYLPEFPLEFLRIPSSFQLLIPSNDMFRKIKCCFSGIKKKNLHDTYSFYILKSPGIVVTRKKKNILPRELSFNYRILCAETLEKIYRTRGRLSRPTVPTHTRATFKESGKRRRTESSPPSPSPSPPQSLVPRLRTEDNKFIFNLSDSRLIYQRRPSVDRGAHLR